MDSELESDRSTAEARQSFYFARVWTQYGIVDGAIRSAGKRHTSKVYFPIAKPALVSEIAKLEPGDEKSALGFAHRWGLLGYADIKRLRGRFVLREEDPLVWIWVHAAGIRAVLRLHDLLNRNDSRELRAFLKTCVLPDEAEGAQYEVNLLLRDEKFAETMEYVRPLFHSRAQIADAHLPPATLVYGDRHRIGGSWWPLTGSSREIAGGIMASIINPNLVGISREIKYAGGPSGFQFRRRWDSVLSVAYFHLSELVAGGSVEECRHCGRLFWQTDLRQRYCPPRDPSYTESACASAFRQRKRRASK